MREDQSVVYLTFEKKVNGRWVAWPGLEDLGPWENRTGGAGDSDETKHREAGIGDNMISLGGPQTIDNVTVARRYDLVRDHAKLKLLMAARGKARVHVSDQPYDEYDVPFGDDNSWTGKLKSVDGGDTNKNSNDVRMISLEISAESFQ